jgi:hypothetical protein
VLEPLTDIIKVTVDWIVVQTASYVEDVLRSELFCTVNAAALLSSLLNKMAPATFQLWQKGPGHGSPVPTTV